MMFKIDFKSEILKTIEIICRFYVPHGLTVDSDDCLWVTDVGAHQVFKLTPLREKTATLQVLCDNEIYIYIDCLFLYLEGV